MQSTIASKEEEQDTHINITVIDFILKEISYKVNKNTPLKKLMIDHSDRVCMDHEKVVIFCLNGRRLGPNADNKTPNELHMKDGDIIRTMFYFGVNVKLTIKGQDGNEASFEMHFFSRLELLMGFYCRRYCLDITRVAFLYNGCFVWPEQTPDKLHMWFGDEIYAVFYDRIAHIELKTKCEMTANVDNSD